MADCGGNGLSCCGSFDHMGIMAVRHLVGMLLLVIAGFFLLAGVGIGRLAAWVAGEDRA